MKTKINYRLALIFMIGFTVLSFTNASAQEKSKKQLKEEKKLEKQNQIALLIDSKEFIFVANRVQPQGGRSINLTSGDFAEFHPDFIKCDLPFFGRAFSGGYGNDNGMKFEGKPTVYSIEKNKKNYAIKIEVRGTSDYYSMMLLVYFEGSATLSITSNNRSSISYDGDIKVFKKDNELENKINK
jgi:hypothetical protein